MEASRSLKLRHSKLTAERISELWPMLYWKLEIQVRINGESHSEFSFKTVDSSPKRTLKFQVQAPGNHADIRV